MSVYIHSSDDGTGKCEQNGISRPFQKLPQRGVDVVGRQPSPQEIDHHARRECGDNTAHLKVGLSKRECRIRTDKRQNYLRICDMDTFEWAKLADSYQGVGHETNNRSTQYSTQR